MRYFLFILVLTLFSCSFSEEDSISNDDPTEDVTLDLSNFRDGYKPTIIVHKFYNVENTDYRTIEISITNSHVIYILYNSDNKVLVKLSDKTEYLFSDNKLGLLESAIRLGVYINENGDNNYYYSVYPISASDFNDWEIQRNFVYDADGKYELTDDIINDTTTQNNIIKVIGSPIPEEYEPTTLTYEYFNKARTEKGELQITVRNVITGFRGTGFGSIVKDGSTDDLFKYNQLDLYDAYEENKIRCTIYLKEDDTNYYYETYPDDNGDWDAQTNFYTDENGNMVLIE